MSQDEDKVKGAIVGFHPGTILDVISSKYDTPFRALLEAVQNAVDSYATEISVYVNIRKRFYVIEDNGNGMSLDRFIKQLGKIGLSQKDRETDYGQKGLGLISFYGKFKTYTFTSTEKACKGRPGWEGYHSHNIGQMDEVEEGLSIPVQHRPDLAKGSIPGWNTRVVAAEPIIPKARLAFSLRALADEIAGRHGEKIASSKCKLTIHWTPRTGKPQTTIIEGAPSFRGKALKMINTRTDLCGRITGQLFFREDKAGQVYVRLRRGSTD